jgi:hypothetical protein
MKKLLTLAVAALLVFTLSACSEETEAAIADLQNSVGTLQTETAASDVLVAELQTANDNLAAQIADLQADMEAAEQANADLADDIAELDQSLTDAQLTLSTTIQTLETTLTELFNNSNAAMSESFNTQISDLTASVIGQIETITAEFDLALADAQAAFEADLAAQQAALEAELAAQAEEFEQQINDANEVIDGLLDDLAVFEIPIIFGVDVYNQSVYEDLDYVLTAFDIQEGDVSSSIVMTSPGSFNEPGTYTVSFEASDSEGNTQTFEVTVNVTIPEQEYANYLSGIDLGKLDTVNKGRLFIAAERYLLDNVYGGVPLYTGATRVMYSDRLQLFSPTFNGVMGFGTAFSQFTADDSTVLMLGDTYGNAGEYTWRARFRTDPTSLNPWTADDSNSSDFIDLFTGSTYTFHFDASKTGYEINPEQASGDPIPVNPEEINGKVYAKIWQIPLRDDLVWTYHPLTDTSSFPAGHEVLDAEDFMWTWKYALDNDWFRAITGGGDFITNGVKNAAEYLAGTADWEDVGLKVVDGNLQFEFTSEKKMFDIKYMLAGGNFSPINRDLFEAVGGETGYGFDPESVASSGVYVFEEWTQGQFLYFAKNPNHPDADMYHYTGQQFRYIETDEQVFEEFLAGRLESSSIPSARIDEFISDPRVKVSPANTTWRLQMNLFGTAAARDAYIAEYPEMGLDPNFEPEPILQYLEMRKALYFGFDRYEAAVNVVKTYLPAYTYYASTYFLDAEGGISVRGTEEGAALLEEFGAGTNAYVPDAAVAYFKSAVQKAIDDGFYTAGTAENYTTIDFSLTYASSGNTGAQNMVAEIKQQYEDLLVDDVNFVNVTITVADVEFPNNYYNFMMIGATDLGIGGISGGLLDAPGFLDTFQDDNISGFTLNWGIDTSTANIPVVYRGLDGVTRNELWSFNAIAQAFNNKRYIMDGQLQTVFGSVDELIDAYLDMAGTALDSYVDGADLAQYILGDTVEQVALDGGYDAVHAKIVTTVDGINSLYVITEENGGFELMGEFGLSATADAAIISHSGYPSYFIAATGPMTDADVVANAYLTSLGAGYTTVDEWLTDTGAPLAYGELWAVDWDGWSDVYVVLHIGDYYVGWYWL